MRLVRNIIIFILAVLIGLVIFMPKSSLYYYLEKQLEKNGLVIYNEKISDKIVYFKLNSANISYQGADIAQVGSLKVTPLIVYNQIEAKNIDLVGMAKQFLNIDIESLKATHSALKPYLIKISAQGSFGLANGYANLKQRVIHMDITEAKDLNSIKKYLKRGEKGWYYESKF